MFYDFSAKQSDNLDLGSMAGDLATGVALPGLSAMRPVYGFVSEGLKPAREAFEDVMGDAVKNIQSEIGRMPGAEKSSFDKVRDVNHALGAGEQSVDDYEVSCEELKASSTSEGREHAQRKGMLQGLVDAGYDPSTPKGRDEIMGAVDAACEYDGEHGYPNGSKLDSLSSLMDDLDSGKSRIEDFDVHGSLGLPLRGTEPGRGVEPAFGTDGPDRSRDPFGMGTGGLMNGGAHDDWFSKDDSLDLGSVVDGAFGSLSEKDLSGAAALAVGSMRAKDMFDSMASHDDAGLSMG